MIQQGPLPCADPLQIVAIGPQFWPGNQAMFDRVGMDVQTKVTQITIGCHRNCLIAIFKERAAAIITVVKVIRITLPDTLGE